MTIRIHAFPRSPRAFKVLCFANHLGIDYELVFVDLIKGAQKQPEFAAINLNMRMPVLEEDGFVLWESNAILQYLAGKKPETGLLPLNERDRADVSRWQFWESSHWDPACATLIFERFVKGAFGGGAPDAVEVEKGLAAFHRTAKVLDAHLKGRRYLCLDRLTVADFSVGAGMTLAQPAGFPLDEYKDVTRWFSALSALPAWQSTLAKAAEPLAA